MELCLQQRRCCTCRNLKAVYARNMDDGKMLLQVANFKMATKLQNDSGRRLAPDRVRHKTTAVVAWRRKS